jgi:hypothetical protein
MAGTLPPDVTLRDLGSTLADPRQFVASVRAVMRRYAKTHGTVVVRLGITGKGQLPNYRIEHAGSGTPICAIDGNSHREWPEGADFRAPGNWSTATMTYDEVEELLRAIIG